jgi:hypothetical protein
MINDLKEDSNKQVNEVRKSTQDLYKKVSNINEKFRKEIETVKKEEEEEKEEEKKKKK